MELLLPAVWAYETTAAITSFIERFGGVVVEAAATTLAAAAAAAGARPVEATLVVWVAAGTEPTVGAVVAGGVAAVVTALGVAVAAAEGAAVEVVLVLVVVVVLVLVLVLVVLGALVDFAPATPLVPVEPGDGAFVVDFVAGVWPVVPTVVLLVLCFDDVDWPVLPTVGPVLV
jgi:hypothetical protein